jgi:hypothetical protein
MAKTMITIFPPLTGIWPDGEPQSVRDAADRIDAAKTVLTPEAPENPRPVRK